MRRTLTLLSLVGALGATAAHAATADLEALGGAARWVDQAGGFWPDQRYVSGDFDGDGLIDLARVYGRGDGNSNVDVWTSTGWGMNPWTRWIDGAGGFAVEQRYLAADVDGDGLDDIVRVFNDGGLTSVDALISDGAHFTYSRRITRSGGNWAEQHYLVGDFDGDGRDDLARVFGESDETSVDIFRAFAPASERWITRSGGFWPGMVFTAGDVDGDGRDDIARAFHDNGGASVDLLRSTGVGFVDQRLLTADGRWFPETQARMDDFDGDGLADLLLFEQKSGLRADVLRSTGLGFERAIYQRAALPGDAHAVGDFDGDGKAELALVQGQFGLANVDLVGVWTPDWEYRARAVRWAGESGGWWDSQIYLEGDFDGDGMPDIVRLFEDAGTTTIDLHRNTADGFEWSRRATREGGHWGGMQFVTGDFDGDGRDDIAKVWDNGGVTSIDVYRMQPDGRFTFSGWLTRQGGHWGGMKFVAGDFDGDGLDDIAKIFGEGGVTSIDVYRSAGDHFPGFSRWMSSTGGFWDAQDYLPGDFTGDGRDDIARVFAGGDTTFIDVLPSSGQSFHQERWSQGFGWYPDQKHVVGDFDGDGLDDIVKVYPTPEDKVGMRLYRNWGGAMHAVHLTDDQVAFSPGGRALAADFDLDGKAEVATMYRTTASALTNFDVYGGATSPDPTLISTSGDLTRHTPEAAVAELAEHGLTLVARSNLVSGECTVVYPNSDALTQGRDLGLLTCAVQIGDDVQLQFTPVYGGCDIGGGAACNIGVFATSVTVTTGPLETTVEVKGPSAEVCGQVSRESVCADVGANLWESSFLVTDGNGNGGGAGAYAGVGAGAGASYDSGVLSGSLDLGLGVGFNVTWSVNLGQAVGYAAEGFTYTMEGVDAAISAAGDAVSTVRDGLDDAWDSASSTISNAAGAVGDFFGGLF